jgi:hypothetical protein
MLDFTAESRIIDVSCSQRRFPEGPPDMATATATETWADGPTVSEGLLGVRRLPGVRARFRLSDAEQLARLSVIPAHLAPTTEADS